MGSGFSRSPPQAPAPTANVPEKQEQQADKPQPPSPPPAITAAAAPTSAPPTLSATFAPFAAAHHTEDYESGAVARRGQAITVTVTVSSGDAAALTWRASALATSGSSRPDTFKMPPLPPAAVGGDGATHEWGVVATGSGGNATLSLCTPADAPAGRYQITVKARTASGASAKAAPLPLLLVFNPWMEADTCYMPKEDEKAGGAWWHKSPTP